MYRSRNFLKNKQLARFLAPSKSPATLSADNALKFVQAIAVIAAGCWILFQYFSFQQKANEMLVKQQELAVEQSAISLKTKEDSDKTNLEKDRLSVKQAEVALKTQEESEKASLEHQRLSITQAGLNLDIQKNQRELREQELKAAVLLKGQEAELNTLKQQQAQHELTRDTAYTFDRSFEVGVRKVRDHSNGSATFEVELEFQITNTSQVEYEISMLIIDYYIGTIPSVSDSFMSFRQTGQPAGRWGAGGIKGAVNWVKLHTSAGMAAEARGKIILPWYDVERELMEELGGIPVGPGTGVRRPKEVMSYSQTYIVNAPTDSYIGFSVSVCFNRAKIPDYDLFHVFYAQKLVDTTPQTITKVEQPKHRRVGL